MDQPNFMRMQSFIPALIYLLFQIGESLKEAPGAWKSLHKHWCRVSEFLFTNLIYSNCLSPYNDSYSITSFIETIKMIHVH